MRRSPCHELSACDLVQPGTELVGAPARRRIHVLGAHDRALPAGLPGRRAWRRALVGDAAVDRLHLPRVGPRPCAARHRERGRRGVVEGCPAGAAQSRRRARDRGHADHRRRHRGRRGRVRRTSAAHGRARRLDAAQPGAQFARAGAARRRDRADPAAHRRPQRALSLARDRAHRDGVRRAAFHRLRRALHDRLVRVAAELARVGLRAVSLLHGTVLAPARPARTGARRPRGAHARARPHLGGVRGPARRIELRRLVRRDESRLDQAARLERGRDPPHARKRAAPSRRCDGARPRGAPSSRRASRPCGWRTASATRTARGAGSPGR